jgi:hypothetical protein
VREFEWIYSRLFFWRILKEYILGLYLDRIQWTTEIFRSVNSRLDCHGEVKRSTLTQNNKTNIWQKCVFVCDKDTHKWAMIMSNLLRDVSFFTRISRIFPDQMFKKIYLTLYYENIYILSRWYLGVEAPDRWQCSPSKTLTNQLYGAHTEHFLVPRGISWSNCAVTRLGWLWSCIVVCMISYMYDITFSNSIESSKSQVGDNFMWLSLCQDATFALDVMPIGRLCWCQLIRCLYYSHMA